MLSQTIALFRLMMRGILSRRLFVLVAILLLIAAIIASFLGELAIINGAAIVAGVVADFLRYSMALLILLMIASSVAEDYECRQFERLLTMPLARWQYIAAFAVVIASLCFVVTIPVALLVSVYSDFSLGLYWAGALWLELFLLGVLGLLAILSLEKIPQAVFFALAVYLFAKLSGLISLMLVESVKMAEGSASSRAVEFIFSAILYVIPDVGAFAENDVFFAGHDLVGTLSEQFVSVVIYAAFLLLVCLVDFYRKEFNR